MTPHAPDIEVNRESADSSGEAGAPAVTPPMISAGCEALAAHNDDFENREDAVVRIFTAMQAARNPAI